jgi:hypothetical protein
VPHTDLVKPKTESAKMNIGYKERQDRYSQVKAPHIFSKVAVDLEAELARDILKALSIASCQPDREDSSGHQRFRLLDPPEAAKRACDIAAAAYAEFRQRGWILDLPEPEFNAKKSEVEGAN